MATKRGKPFTAGNQAAVGKGRPKTPKELQGIRKLDRSIVELVLAKFAAMTREDITNLMKDPGTSMLEIMIGSVMVKAAQDGDYTRLNFFLDRAIGKVLSPIEITNKPYEAIDVTPDNHDELWQKAHSITRRLRVVNEG